MKVKYRLAAAATAVALLLTGCVPSMTGQSSGSVVASSGSVPHTALPTPEQVRIPWFGEDTLNPYSCDTLQNYYLAGLLCDPLVALDSSNRPVNRLALEISSTDQLQYIITLRSDAHFSDGSAVTSADVLYSLTLAQAAERYAGGLRGVASAVASNDSSLTITLNSPDRYFPRSLVFPVLKVDTGELPVPVGVGRFTAELAQGRLVRNERYYNPVQNIRQVTLVNTSSLEEQSYGIMEGTIDLMYSDLQSDLNLGLGIGYRQIPLSNLVYLGINHNRSWATKGVRQALSGLVRREDIARRVYTGFAAVASMPINPVTATTALDVADLEVNVDKQKALLEAEGWKLQENGSRVKDGVTMQLELIAPDGSNEKVAAAEQIAELYRQVGIAVTVTKLPFNEYSARIATGNYDLCIAETRLAYNMEITAVALPTTGAENPVQLFPELGTLYRAVKAGTAEQSELEAMLRTELPVIPILFRRGILCFSRDFSANIVATEQDIFYNIVEW